MTHAHALRAALRTAQPQALPGGKSGASLLRLPPGVRWLQLGDEPLFVRHFYRDCFEGPLESLKPGARFTIIGNTGIGKSAFGEYLLWQAVRAGRTAVYVSDKSSGFHIFHADGRAVVLDKDAFKDTLDVLFDPSTVLIYDGDGEGRGRPPIVRATTVLVTSPKRSRFKEFQRTGASSLVFPVFARDEIDDLLAAAFPALHAPEARAGVWARYGKWGGIPRYVLSLIGDEHQGLLDDALTDIDLDRLADVLVHATSRFIEGDDAVSHRLFHLKPRGETEHGFVGASAESFRLGCTVLASRHVVDAVYQAMLQRESDRLLAVLAQPTSNPAVAKF